MMDWIQTKNNIILHVLCPKGDYVFNIDQDKDILRQIKIRVSDKKMKSVTNILPSKRLTSSQNNDRYSVMNGFYQFIEFCSDNRRYLFAFDQVMPMIHKVRQIQKAFLI
jgi:hypothetical protein